MNRFNLSRHCRNSGHRPLAGARTHSRIQVHRNSSSGYLLVEALVYIGLVFLLVGIGTAAMFRSIDNSVALRRNADDISRAVHTGERWRADMRLAVKGVVLDKDDQRLLRLKGRKTEVDYRFDQEGVFRRLGTGPWSKVLSGVRSSSVEREARPGVNVWRWELELQTKAHGSFKPGKIRPLFTFLSVEPPTSKP